MILFACGHEKTLAAAWNLGEADRSLRGMPQSRRGGQRCGR